MLKAKTIRKVDKVLFLNQSNRPDLLASQFTPNVVKLAQSLFGRKQETSLAKNMNY